MSQNYIGTTGYGPTQIEAIPNKYPKYNVYVNGVYSQVNATASIYAGLGWDVTVTQGNPTAMVATIQSELQSDGMTPISSSGVYNTVNWAMHYDECEKSILHAGVAYVPWITQLTQTQINILEKALSDPPTGSLSDLYPQFNTATGSSGMAPPTFSSSYLPYTVTAGDVVWNMSLKGIRDIPISQPVLRYSATVGSAFTLTSYTSNLFATYSPSTLVSAWSIPSNWSAVINAISNLYTNPSTSDTYGIPFYYGWQKKPPTMDQQGSIINIQQEYKFGLYPQNIFGSVL